MEGGLIKEADKIEAYPLFTIQLLGFKSKVDKVRALIYTEVVIIKGIMRLMRTIKIFKKHDKAKVEVEVKRPWWQTFINY